MKRQRGLAWQRTEHMQTEHMHHERDRHAPSPQAAAVRYRPALPADAPACIDLRGRTRENAFSKVQLEAMGITADSWSEGIRDGALPGHVGLVNEQIVGYCFGERATGEILVLALLPEHEGTGMGRQLLQCVIDDFKGWGWDRLFLGCSDDPMVRSHGFYRHLGWQPTGARDAAGDEILELRLA